MALYRPKSFSLSHLYVCVSHGGDFWPSSHYSRVYNEPFGEKATKSGSVTIFLQVKRLIFKSALHISRLGQLSSPLHSNNDRQWLLQNRTTSLWQKPSLSSKRYVMRGADLFAPRMRLRTSQGKAREGGADKDARGACAVARQGTCH